MSTTTDAVKRMAEHRAESLRDAGVPDPLVPGYVNRRAEVLLGAEKLVNGDRNVAYGDPRADFKRTADLWNTYLGNTADFDRVIAPHDVAAMMALLKISRIAWSPEKLDSWQDLAGYAACGFDCVDTESSFG